MALCNGSWTHVHMCAAVGYIDGMRNLQEIEIYKRTCSSETAMHIAAAFGRLDVLIYLIDNYPRMLSLCTSKNETVLQMAVSAHKTDVVKMLLEIPFVWSDQSSIAIKSALENNYLDILILICHYRPKVVICRDPRGNTLLHLAVLKHKIEILQYLLTIVPTELIAATNQAGRTALHYAVDEYLLPMVIALYKADPAAIEIPDSCSQTPFRIASHHPEIMEYFLRMHPTAVEQTTSTGWTALHGCTSADSARMLVSFKPDLVDQVDDDGNTALHYCDDASFPISEFLIQCKPSILSIENHKNQTPLHRASCAQNYKIVQTILNFKPDIVDTNEKGVTALHVATYSNEYDVIERVFKCHPSDVNSRDKKNITPFHISMQEEANRDVVQLFLPHISIETAIDTHDVCKETLNIDLQAIVWDDCASLNTYLLPELANLVHAFLGIAHFKKRKRM